MKKSILFLALFASVQAGADTLNNGATSLKKISHNQTVSCGNQVYVKSKNGISLKEEPNNRARTVMKLKPNQYLCIVAGVSASKEWTLVKKVPLLVDHDKSACKGADKKGCNNIEDFPTPWKIRKPAGDKCQLTSMADDNQISVVATGVCATGWVKTKSIQTFAD